MKPSHKLGSIVLSNNWAENLIRYFSGYGFLAHSAGGKNRKRWSLPKAGSVIPTEIKDSHPVQSTPQRQALFVSSSKVKNLAKAQYPHADLIY